MILKLGTRGSALALAQSGQLAERLKKTNPDLEIQTVVIKTSGDLFSAQTPQKAYALSGGTKGLFVKEIEEALLSGEIDLAVHSAKDLPSELAPGLVIAAYPEREDPRDVFIGRNGLSWKNFPASARLGTSSLRRQRQLAAAKPGLNTVPLRGNVDTRLKKLETGELDGLVLARAGLLRLGRGGVPHEALPIELVVPAPGQGALAVEVAANRKDLLSLLTSLDHPGTRLEVEHEREVLKALGGGCSTPLGALAKAEADGVRLEVFWSDPEGTASARLSAVCPKKEDPAAFAKTLAARIKSKASKTA